MHIHLKDLEFSAHHGVYDQERVNGNTFIVNVHIGFESASQEVIQALEETINYENVFTLVKERMAIPTPLLETICGELVRSILDNFPMAMHAEVAIEKKVPPIPGMKGSVVVVESLQRMPIHHEN